MEMSGGVVEMDTLIESLPGVLMPVSSVTQALAEMWQGEDKPSEFRAIQMNLVLHFGLNISMTTAREQFNVAIRFAQRYPCRIIVLCPQVVNDPQALMQAKLFSQCYIGSSFREVCCCEALILGYNTKDSGFLENQVSIWLESDLPLYHWIYGVPAKAIEQHYLGFIRRCKRVVFDSNTCRECYGNIPWPSPASVRDMAFSRGLSARQAIGPFLSTFSPKALVEDLMSVRQRCARGYEGDANHLLNWQKACIEACFHEAGITPHNITYQVEVLPDVSRHTTQIVWNYHDGRKFFRWNRHTPTEAGTVSADFGEGVVSHGLHVRKMKEEDVLAESLFF
jgi:hypothetical protein